MARVLIVDDNATNSKLLEFVVRKAGHEAVVAHDADSALTQIDACVPELVLLDLQLPGVDGLELCRRLRAQPATRDLPILAVTAYAMKGDREKAFEAGCDDYITKPIDTRTLPQTIARHLERREAQP